MRLYETFNIHKKINSIFPFFKSKYLCKKGIHCYILNIQDTVIPHYYKEEDATHRRIVSKIIEYEHIHNTNLKCLCCGKEVRLEEGGVKPMNNIEILENYVKELNENKKNHKLAYSTGFGKYWSDFGKAIENLIQENKELKETLNDRIDVKQTADSISFTMPSKLAAASMKVLNESALAIENKRLCELLEKQEKIINNMVEEIYHMINMADWIDIKIDKLDCKEEVLKYFKKEVEKEC